MLILKFNNLNVNVFFFIDWLTRWGAKEQPSNRVQQQECMRRKEIEWVCKLKRKLRVAPTFISGVCYNANNFHFIISLVFCTGADKQKAKNSNRKLCVRGFFFFFLSIFEVIHCNFRALMISSTLSTALQWNNGWMRFFFLFFTFGVNTYRILGAVKWSSIIFEKKKNNRMRVHFLHCTNDCYL